eukprot:GILK01009045.1.p1 GENE.GILK01009045.1~~GILK01009045.1.p1  ORF type:complete len:1017 (-),score=159.85 GILK01009045.1:107-3109(-)
MEDICLTGGLLESVSLDVDIRGIDVIVLPRQSPGSNGPATMIAVCTGKHCFVLNGKTFGLLAHLNKTKSFHKKNIRLCRFLDAEGLYVATCGEDLKLIVWDVRTRRPKHTLSGHQDVILHAMVSPEDPELLLTSSADGSVLCWNWMKGNLIGRDPVVRVSSTVQCFDFYGPRQLLATSSNNGSANIWVVEDGVATRLLGGIKGAATTNKADSYSNRLKSSEDALSAFDVYMLTKENPALFQGWADTEGPHTGAVTHVTFSPNGRYIVTASIDCTLKVWGVASFMRHKEKPDAESIPRTGSDNAGRYINISEGDPIHNGNLEDQPLDVGFHATLAATCRHEGVVLRAMFTYDSRFILSSSLDATLRMWHPESGQLLYQINTPLPVVDFRLMQDGQGRSGRYLLLCGCEKRLLHFEIQMDAEEMAARSQQKQQQVQHDSTKQVRFQQFNPRLPTLVGTALTNPHAPSSLVFHRNRMASSGITSSDMQMALAHGALLPDFLANLIANTVGVNRNQLRDNLAKTDLSEGMLIRALTRTAYAAGDVLKALSQPIERCAALLKTIKAGLSMNHTMSQLGYQPRTDGRHTVSIIQLNSSDLDMAFCYLGGDDRGRSLSPPKSPRSPKSIRGNSPPRELSPNRGLTSAERRYRSQLHHFIPSEHLHLRTALHNKQRVPDVFHSMLDASADIPIFDRTRQSAFTPRTPNSRSGFGSPRGHRVGRQVEGIDGRQAGKETKGSLIRGDPIPLSHAFRRGSQIESPLVSPRTNFISFVEKLSGEEELKKRELEKLMEEKYRKLFRDSQTQRSPCHKSPNRERSFAEHVSFLAASSSLPPATRPTHAVTAAESTRRERAVHHHHTPRRPHPSAPLQPLMPQYQSLYEEVLRTGSAPEIQSPPTNSSGIHQHEPNSVVRARAFRALEVYFDPTEKQEAGRAVKKEHGLYRGVYTINLLLQHDPASEVVKRLAASEPTDLSVSAHSISFCTRPRRSSPPRSYDPARVRTQSLVSS